jgi:hypothetical protein
MDKKEKPSIFIATPMYGGVCHGYFMKSVMGLVMKLTYKGYKVTFNDLYNESLINRARNTLTELFLRSDADYLLFIDGDEGFNADGVIDMIDTDLDIIGAAVPMKAINWANVEKAAELKKPDLKRFGSYVNINFVNRQDLHKVADNPKKPLEVKNIGTGLLLIKRNVFETMKEHVGKYKSDQLDLGGIKKGEYIYDFWKTQVDPEEERLLSEDYYFCTLWRKLGGSVYVAPHVKVVHVGTYIFV